MVVVSKCVKCVCLGAEGKMKSGPRVTQPPLPIWGLQGSKCDSNRCRWPRAHFHLSLHNSQIRLMWRGRRAASSAGLHSNPLAFSPTLEGTHSSRAHEVLEGTGSMPSRIVTTNSTRPSREEKIHSPTGSGWCKSLPLLTCPKAATHPGQEEFYNTHRVQGLQLNKCTFSICIQGGETWI